MSREKVFNFSAGPSVLPESALLRAQSELLNYKSCGISVMEMSHRSSMFQEIFDNTKAKLIKALKVPETHEVLFLQGGATLQFAQIPMNLMDGGHADYVITGNFSGKAAKEAEKYGGVHIAADSSATGHDRIPAASELQQSKDARYFYYCSNNTVFGTEWQYVPQSEAALVCDMSSDILSRPLDVSHYALIYAGAQKNMAPAGLTIVIIDKRIAGREYAYTPQIMSYENLIKADSMLNTPPCWNIYMLGLVLDWLEEQGGVSAMEQIKRERAAMVYDYLDNSTFYSAHARPGSRSDMNLSFRTKSAELDALFVKGSAARGLLNLKGHKVAGGMRASLYNAMPMEGVLALLDYMKEFEKENV